MLAPWRKGVGGHTVFAIGPVRRGNVRRRGRVTFPGAELLEGRALLSFVTTVDSAGIDPVSVAVGDFNGDGRADVAVANNSAGSGTVSVRLSNPDGSLAPVSSTAAVPAPTTQLLAADLNGDGKADLVTVGQSTSGSVILNNGSGILGAAAQVGNNFGENLLAVTAADFNGDHKPELVFGLIGFVNNQLTASTQGVFEIEGNNGDGIDQDLPLARTGEHRATSRWR